MKHKLLLVLFITSLSVFSQEDRFKIPKEKTAIGGTFTLNSQKSFFKYNTSDERKSQSENFNFAPFVGFFIEDNLEFGLMVSTSISNEKEPSYANSTYFSESKHYDFGAGAYVRGYIPMGAKLAFDIKGGFLYSYYKSQNYSSNMTDVYVVDGNVFTIDLVPGFTYKLNDVVMFKLNFGSVGFQNASSKNGSQYRNVHQNLFFDINLSNISGGIAFVL